MSAPSSGRRPITNDDLFALRVIGEFQVAPDGKRVVFTLTHTDVEADRTFSNLWLADMAGHPGGGALTQLTTASANDSAPRWSPDGRTIAFVSDRAERKELWLIAPDGGEARRLTRGESDVSQPAWSPDGRRLVYVAKTPRAADDDPTHAAQDGSDVRVITQLGYKADGEGFWDGQDKHLFTIAVEGGASAQLTDGPWDDTDPVWSPDGSRIAFVSRRTPDREWTDTSDIFTVPADGGEPTRVTAGDGPYRAPVWSPDGTRLAYVGHNRPPESGPTTLDWLWTIPAAGGEPACLTRDLDRGVADFAMGDVVAAPGQPPLQWTARGIAFIYGEHGATVLAMAQPDSGAVTPLVRDGRNVLGLHAAGDELVYLVSTMTLPCDLFARDLSDAAGRERRLTAINRELLDELAVPEPERIAVAVDDGVEMDGWLLHPPGFDAARPYPLILDIHGGPRGQYGNSFMHAFHRYAAEGYVVAYFNPRGSTGYGQAFTSRLTGDWGGVDVHDVMAGLEAALERRPYLSADRVGITGGSYGGYLTNMLIGMYPDRWQAAVTERSTLSRISSYGTSDMIWRSLEWEFGGPYWENRDFYWDRSPIAHVQNISVPLLIIHSENDHRCTISEAEQLFTALRRRGNDVVFVRFPNESHGLSRSGKPKHRRERLERIVGWFDTYLQAR